VAAARALMDWMTRLQASRVASLKKDILSLLTDEQLEILDGWLLARMERQDPEGLQRVHEHRVDKGWRYDEDGVLRAPPTGPSEHYLNDPNYAPGSPHTL